MSHKHDKHHKRRETRPRPQHEQTPGKAFVTFDYALLRLYLGLFSTNSLFFSFVSISRIFTMVRAQVTTSYSLLDCPTSDSDSIKRKMKFAENGLYFAFLTVFKMSGITFNPKVHQLMCFSTCKTFPLKAKKIKTENVYCRGT